MTNDKQAHDANEATMGPSRSTAGLCGVCGRPPHVCDDPECVPANAPLAEKVRFLMAENARLREQIAELSDAFTVVWVSDDHAAWDGKAVEKFNALVATHNAALTGERSESELKV